MFRDRSSLGGRYSYSPPKDECRFCDPGYLVPLPPGQ